MIYALIYPVYKKSCNFAGEVGPECISLTKKNQKKKTNKKRG